MTGTAIEPKRILLPTDFSAAAAQAFPQAVWFARRFGARITLVYVVPATLPAEVSHIGIVLEENRLVGEAEKTLAGVRNRDLPADLEVDTLVLRGGPCYEICQAAARLGTDLIVLSTHGHGGLKHVLLGSTTERVVRHAPCPVLAVRGQLVPIRLPDDAPCRFGRILVPNDFSQASANALGCAAALGGSCGACFTLLHVVEPPNYPAWGYAHLAFRDNKLKRIARRKLEGLRAELPPVTSADVVVTTGDAALKIVETAEEQKTDLIVISTRGHSGLARLLLGSVAEKVVRLAPCPVLVVRGISRSVNPAVP